MSDIAIPDKTVSVLWIFAALLVLGIVVVFIATGGSTPAEPQIASFVGPTVDIANAEVLIEPSIGTRKALLFGLNYMESPYELRGSIEDVGNLQEVLQAAGFAVETCTDESVAAPTRNVMQAKLAAFLLELQPGDMAVLWYSGHGLLLADGENAWVPLDFQRSGFIDEGWVRAHLAALPEGVRLFIGSDACHSGTTFDLKYDVEPQLASRSISKAYRSVLQTKAAARKALAHRDLDIDATRTFEVLDAWSNRDELAATVVVLSGSKDDELSAEGFEEGEFQGAMTWAFIDAIENFGRDMSIGSLQDSMRAQLAANNYAQTPQVSFSRLFSPHTTLAAFGF
jgi:hypothetical protein